MRELIAATIGAIILIAWGVAATNRPSDQWLGRMDGAEAMDEVTTFGATNVDGGALDRDAGLAR
ncbi:MAG: hypothetical protein GC155_06810 [Alphaproteobacteria bacterium]|nr:hypothetical protein [Alphaproteobacteria bacterium]